MYYYLVITMNQSQLLNEPKKSNKRKVEKRELNIEGKEQQLWLVKVPSFVAKKWSTAEHDEIVGVLTNQTVMGPNQKLMKKMEIKLNDKNELKKENNNDDINDDPESKVSDFSLEAISFDKDGQLLAFSHVGNDENEGYAILGNITKKLDMKPRGTAQYREIIKGRTIKADTKKESRATDHQLFTKSSDVAKYVVDFRLPKTEFKKNQLIEKRRKECADDMAQSESLRSIIFEVFAQNEHNTFKDLINICKDQPGYTKEKDFKEMLDNYAFYHTKGPWRGNYELKPEFKDFTAEYKIE